MFHLATTRYKYKWNSDNNSEPPTRKDLFQEQPYPFLGTLTLSVDKEEILSGTVQVLMRDTI